MAASIGTGGRRRAVSVLVLAVLVVACGASDEAVVSLPVSDAPTTSTTTAAPPDTQVDEVLPSTSTEPAQPTDAAVSTTSSEAPPVVTDADPEADGAGGDTVPEADVGPDDEALAFLARGLYSVPGANTHCELTEVLGAHLLYAFPAEGGDLYALCLIDEREENDPLVGAQLRLVDPAGTVRVDVVVDELTAGPQFDVVRQQLDERSIESRIRAPLLLTYPDGRAVVHGARLHTDPGRAEFSVPIFLPHDRPAGDWTLSFDGASATPTMIDAPCAVPGVGGTTDPLLLRPDLRFVREAPINDEPPIPFEHCRLFPDVVDLTIAEARTIIDAWATVLGATVEYDVITPCAPESIVMRSAPRAGQVTATNISAPNRFVQLFREGPCEEPAAGDGSTEPSPDQTVVTGPPLTEAPPEG